MKYSINEIKSCNLCELLALDDSYGSSWSVEIVLDCLINKKESITSYLKLLNHFGMLNRLVFLCIFVDLCAKRDTIKWFYKKLSICSEEKEIIKLKERVRRLLDDMQLGFQPFEWTDYFSICESDYQSIVWKAMDSEYLDKIEGNDSKLIGLYFPGCFEEIGKAVFMEILSTKVFPILISYGRDSRNHDMDMEKTAVIRMYTCFYLAEFEYEYSQLSFWVNTPLIEEPAEIIANESDDDFRKHIQKLYYAKMKKQINIPEPIVDQIYYLIRNTEYEGDYRNHSSIERLKIELPIFYQLSGKSERACALMFENIYSLAGGAKKRNSFLIVFYRNMLRMREPDRRKEWISIFDQIYYNNAAKHAFNEFAKDVIDFCGKLTNRIKRELQKESGKRKAYIFGIEPFCRNIIANGLLIKRLTELYQESENGNLLDQMTAKAEFSSIFMHLSSHSEQEIRISTFGLIRTLHPEDDFHCEDEIFSLYTYKEAEILRLLRKRMDQMHALTVSYDDQMKYQRIVNQVEKYWKNDQELFLCEKLIGAYHCVQSFQFFSREIEDAYNDLVSYYLKAYYGENNIKREEPQGKSGIYKNTKKPKSGNTDITIYRNGEEIGIQEALIESSLNKNSLDSHMERLMVRYNCFDVRYLILTIYYTAQNISSFAEKLKNYLESYPYPVDSNTSDAVGTVEYVAHETGNIRHYRVAYQNGRRLLHVFCVQIHNE